MYWQRVISIVCIYALLALSFDFLAHYVGLVSLGGAFFIGVGGYIAALLNKWVGFSPFLSIPAAGIFGAAHLHRAPAPLSAARGESISPS